MRTSHFLNMSLLSFEERQFIINCFFENNKSFTVVNRKYHAKFKSRYQYSKVISKLLNLKQKSLKKFSKLFLI